MLHKYVFLLFFSVNVCFNCFLTLHLHILLFDWFCMLLKEPIFKKIHKSLEVVFKYLYLYYTSGFYRGSCALVFLCVSGSTKLSEYLKECTSDNTVTFLVIYIYERRLQTLRELKNPFITPFTSFIFDFE